MTFSIRFAIVCLISLFFTANFAFASNKKGSFRSDYEAAVRLMGEKSYDAAIESFQKALRNAELPADQARIYNYIGLAYLEQGISDKSALGSFEQALRLDPKFTDAYFNIASYYAHDNRNPKKAAEYFKKTVEVDPGYFKAYFGLGWFSLIQDQNASQAVKYFQKTVEKNPKFAEAHYGLGLAYLREQQAYMVLGAISTLRSLKREDLAQALEKSLTELSAPPVKPADAQTAQQAATDSKAQGKGRMGQAAVTMKGRLTPPKSVKLQQKSE